MTDKRKYKGKVIMPFKVGHGKKQKRYIVGKPYETQHKGTFDYLINTNRIKPVVEKPIVKDAVVKPKK